MIAYLFLLAALSSVCADLNKINVYVRHYVGEKNYKSLYDEDINNLQDFKSITLFNTTVPVLYENDVKSFYNLEELSISAVKLATLHPKCFVNIPRLRYLYLAGNNLRKIVTGVFENLPITKLILSENQISTIDDKSFNLPRLLSLDLSKNRLEHIKPNWFTNCENLKELHVNSNRLTLIQNNVFVNVKGLRYVDFSRNQIKKLDEDAFNHINDLKILNLSRNKLQRIPDGIFRHQDNLRILQLIGNNITCLSDKVLDSLGERSIVFLTVNRIGIECRNKCMKFNKEHPNKHVYY